GQQQRHGLVDARERDPGGNAARARGAGVRARGVGDADPAAVVRCRAIRRVIENLGVPSLLITTAIRRNMELEEMKRKNKFGVKRPAAAASTTPQQPVPPQPVPPSHPAPSPSPSSSQTAPAADL